MRFRAKGAFCCAKNGLNIARPRRLKITWRIRNRRMQRKGALRKPAQRRTGAQQVSRRLAVRACRSREHARCLPTNFLPAMTVHRKAKLPNNIYTYYTLSTEGKKIAASFLMLTVTPNMSSGLPCSNLRSDATHGPNNALSKRAKHSLACSTSCSCSVPK